MIDPNIPATVVPAAIVLLLAYSAARTVFQKRSRKSAAIRVANTPLR